MLKTNVMSFVFYIIYLVEYCCWIILLDLSRFFIGIDETKFTAIQFFLANDWHLMFIIINNQSETVTIFSQTFFLGWRLHVSSQCLLVGSFLQVRLQIGPPITAMQPAALAPTKRTEQIAKRKSRNFIVITETDTWIRIVTGTEEIFDPCGCGYIYELHHLE